MGKKTLAAFAAAAMGVSGVLAASPATANTTYSGAYAQWTGPLRCVGHVYDDGDGGQLRVEVKAMEVRPSDKHFRTWRVATRVIAQEKTYSGAWKSVAATKAFHGRLGPARNVNGYNVSRVHWGGDFSPTLRVNVRGYDDLFRAKVVTRFFDDEGVMIKRLVTRQGQCRL